MKKINIGLMGYGYIGKVHTLAYKTIPVVSSDLSKAYNMALLFSNSQKENQGTGWSKVISSLEDSQDDNLDIVDICTPNFLHLEQVNRFINKGVNIYCEKPMALNYEESNAMAQKASRKGLTTQVALVYRFMPAIAKARAIIKEKGIGDIISFRAQLLHSSYLNPNREITWRLQKEKSGGGAIMDLGIHLIDTVRFLLGEIKSLSAETRTVFKERPQKNSSLKAKVNVDDWGLITLELMDKGIGTIEVSKVSHNPFSAFLIEVYGTGGYLAISDKDPYNPAFQRIDNEKTYEITAKAEKDKYVEYLKSIYPTAKMTMGLMLDIHIASLINMIQNVRHGVSSYDETPTFEEGAKTQRIVDLAYESHKREGQRIEL